MKGREGEREEAEEWRTLPGEGQEPGGCWGPAFEKLFCFQRDPTLCPPFRIGALLPAQVWDRIAVS